MASNGTNGMQAHGSASSLSSNGSTTSNGSASALKPRLSRDKRTSSERKLFTPTADKLVLVMVGLPARGKSFIAKKLCKFVNWKGLKCEVFNVGQLRRAMAGGGHQDHSFFDPKNTKAKEEREQLAHAAFDRLQEWFIKGDSNAPRGGDVAIFDATNSTRARRQWLLESFHSFAKVHHVTVNIVFVESICTNEAVINTNILQKVTSSPDYQHMDVQDAMADLRRRMQNYEAAYEGLDDDEDISYIKLFDLQSKVHAKGIYGHVAKSILPYMMSFHIEPRPIWLVRAGHCTEVRKDFTSIVKDPCIASRSAHLSSLGITFAKDLSNFVQERKQEHTEHMSLVDEDVITPLLILTSTLPRAVETAQYLPFDCQKQMATLNPLDKGECYGISMSQMEEQMPDVFDAYKKDPWQTRFPGGESYFDLMTRLEPILIDVEQHTGPVMIISHISTLQVLYAYFRGEPIERSPQLEIPFHSVLELLPKQDGWTTNVYNLRS